MQGRLLPPVENRIQSFPKDRWAEEFSLAALLGIQTIEWIYEDYGSKENPIATDVGIMRLKELSSQYGIKVLSLCADYFMDYPLLRCSVIQQRERIAKLEWLLERAQQAAIASVVLPFVDHSNIKNEEEIKETISLLQEVLPFAERYQVELHLETDLEPHLFSSLLHRLPHPLLKVNYDSGNSASLGYSISEEFKAYGERIGSVHIKDRLRGGGTVPLGQGDVSFAELAAALQRIDYQRPLILQIARGVSGSEVDWVRENIKTVKTIFKKTDHS
ncbi:MAG: sugar phosphate isomerase/epimerase [Chthoniobacterales bacterium]|nr:sugar phosphate isomerase/epimerase [Chthoniobacterales bacterium]